MRNQTENIERQWAIRLAEEFTTICHGKEIVMRAPNFTISSTTKTIGSWDSTSKTISISKNLILTHNWDVVIEVLKHEMAHQYTSEILSTKELPHGESFKLACDIFAVHPDFRNATGEIPKFLNKEAATHTKENKTLKKIEKLLALADSAEEHEASAAMNKANELIANYNINLDIAAEKATYCYRQIYVGKKNVTAWSKIISGIVRDYFFVQTIIISQYDARTDSTYKAIELIGREHNIAIAEHVFKFLTERIEILWNIFRAQNNASARDKRSYYFGLLYGFREKLKEADEKRNETLSNSTTTSALVVANDHGLTSFAHDRYPHTKNRSVGSLKINKSVYDSGIEEGKKLTIHKTIHRHSNKQKKLISN